MKNFEFNVKLKVFVKIAATEEQTKEIALNPIKGNGYVFEGTCSIEKKIATIEGKVTIKVFGHPNENDEKKLKLLIPNRLKSIYTGNKSHFNLLLFEITDSTIEASTDEESTSTSTESSATTSTEVTSVETATTESSSTASTESTTSTTTETVVTQEATAS